jgi:hypothetical protein
MQQPGVREGQPLAEEDLAGFHVVAGAFLDSFDGLEILLAEGSHEVVRVLPFLG